jgi:hypothetical protein
LVIFATKSELSDFKSEIIKWGIPVNRNCLLSEDLTLIGGNKKPQN